MTEPTATAWQCPKDAMTMQPMGRRSGAWRCPTCRGVFIDTEAMRRRRRGGPAKVSPVVTSVLLGLVATYMVRRLRRRSRTETPSQPEIGRAGL